MKKKVLSVLLVTGIILSGSTISNAASKSVSINGSQTGASSSIAYINANTSYSKSIRNENTYQNKKLYVEVKQIQTYFPDKVICSDGVAAGSSATFSGKKLYDSANYYVHLDPSGVQSTGCVGTGSFNW